MLVISIVIAIMYVPEVDGKVGVGVEDRTASTARRIIKSTSYT